MKNTCNAECFILNTFVFFNRCMINTGEFKSDKEHGGIFKRIKFFILVINYRSLHNLQLRLKNMILVFVTNSVLSGGGISSKQLIIHQKVDKRKKN